MTPISPSELILNADGSVYHLDLRPEDIASIILTAGDPGRVPCISRHFDHIELKRQKREFVTHTGMLGGKRITAISTGIGPDNIDIVLNELDALANIDFETRQIRREKKVLRIIRLGTSGGLQPDLPVGDLVAAHYGLGLDNLIRFYPYQPSESEAKLYDDFKTYQQHTGALPIDPYVVEGSDTLRKLLADDMHQGITVTAPGFYGPQGRHLRLKSTFNPSELTGFSFKGLKITNFEMETSAIYGMARLLGHQALSCNALLVNRATGSFSRQPKQLENKLIETVLERISDTDF